MTYGNGDSVSYTYDAFDRQRTAAYNDVDRTTHEQKNVATYHYDYSSDNALTRQYATDSSGITEQYSYQYDSLGRLIHSRQSTGTGALIQSTQHMYDAANRMTSRRGSSARACTSSSTPTPDRIVTANRSTARSAPSRPRFRART